MEERYGCTCVRGIDSCAVYGLLIVSSERIKRLKKCIVLPVMEDE